MLEQKVGKKVHLKIEEIKIPELDARLVAESIAEQLSRRVSYRRAMKHAVGQAMRRNAKGIKIRLGGRLGAQKCHAPSPRWMVASAAYAARRHRLRCRARTDHIGRIGVKVWIYRGDILPERRVPNPAPQPEAVEAAVAD